MGPGAGLGLLALVLLAAFTLVPRMVSNRTQASLSYLPQDDSSTMRVLDVAQSNASTPVGHRLLLHPNVKGGQSVTSASTNRQVPVKQNRELAKARAARAAAAAERGAAAQRRLVASALVLIALCTFGGLAAAEVLSWWWAGGLAVVFAGLIAASVVAGKRGRQADAQAVARIEAAGAALAEVSPSVMYSPRRRDVLRIITGQTPQVSPDKSEASAPAGNSTWTPMYIPKPSYQLKPLVQPRQLKATEKVADQPAPAAPVPYRPRRSRANASLTWSTVEVIENSAVKLDVEKILDSRRAV